MADLPPDSDDEDTSTPRWVYVFGAIVVFLVVVFIIVHLIIGGLGNHSP